MFVAVDAVVVADGVADVVVLDAANVFVVAAAAVVGVGVVAV